MLIDLLLAIGARLDALVCKLRGHNVDWHAGPDDLCPTGDIVCHYCDVVYWCRALDPWSRSLFERSSRLSDDEG